MLRPINKSKTKTAAMGSSNQIKWDGPDIPCINLCKNDTITEVTYKLATEVCKMMEQLDPSNYNLECLDLDHCDNITFQQLFQALINQVYCENGNGGGGNNGGGGTPSENCCDGLPFIPQTVYYAQNELGEQMGESPFLLNFSEYTVQEPGIYEIDFLIDVEIPIVVGNNFNPLRGMIFNLTIDGVEYSPNILGRKLNIEEQDFKPRATLPIRYFASNITLQENQVCIIKVVYEYPPVVPGEGTAILNRGVIKITKIG
jgi:hypothetical protein